jgi:hypothetical protein
MAKMAHENQRQQLGNQWRNGVIAILMGKYAHMARSRKRKRKLRAAARARQRHGGKISLARQRQRLWRNQQTARMARQRRAAKQRRQQRRGEKAYQWRRANNGVIYQSESIKDLSKRNTISAKYVENVG